MAKPTLTAAEIAQARGQIEMESDARKRGDLYEQLQTKTPYHNQRNNQSVGKGGKAIGDIMCNLTSTAMVLETLGIGNPDPGHYPQFEDYLEHVRVANKLPERTTEGGWGGVAAKMGAKYKMPGTQHKSGSSLVGNYRSPFPAQWQFCPDEQYGPYYALTGRRRKWAGCRRPLWT